MTKDTALLEALDHLDDQSLRATTHTWWRKGNRGHLHGMRHCWKANSASTVRLTLEQAATKPRCRLCFTSGLPDKEIIAAAVHLAGMQSELARAEEQIATNTAESISEALDSSAETLESLDRMERYGRNEHIRNAWIATRERAAEINQTAKRSVGAHQHEVLRAVACDLRAIQEGKEEEPSATREVYHVPYATEDAVARFGELRQGIPVLTMIYSAWVTAVADGRDPQEAVKACTEQYTRLSTLDQLAGVHVNLDGPSEARKAVELAWEERTKEDIRELTRAWEAAVEENLAANTPVTLGTPGKHIIATSGQANEVLSVLRSYKHVETENIIVGTYPQVVAWWLTYRVRRHLERAEIVLTQEQLTTAAALWQPDSKGAYTRLSEAAKAAVAL